MIVEITMSDGASCRWNLNFVELDTDVSVEQMEDEQLEEFVQLLGDPDTIKA